MHTVIHLAVPRMRKIHQKFRRDGGFSDQAEPRVPVPMMGPRKRGAKKREKIWAEGVLGKRNTNMRLEDDAMAQGARSRW